VFTGAGHGVDQPGDQGVAFAQKLAGLGDHTTVASEHHAVLTCEYLSRFGFETTFLPWTPRGW
jgi:cysteine desulfurase